MAGKVLSDVDFFDLYSCFPCAANIAAMEIGLDVNNPPPLSITGGLSYFGGPGNNYSMHAIVHAIKRLRKYPEQFGLITAMGWFLTKHAAGIYSGIEPEKPWQRTKTDALQQKIDAMGSPSLSKHPKGPATVETYTVVHESMSDGPFPVIIARLDAGERCFATMQNDPSLIAAMESEEFIGRKGRLTPGSNGLNIFTLIE
jgi:acetyl-CoA C-acetyltransferase